ncbi:MAG: CapA family protein, partial [Thermomicrobiales bacterium]
MPAWRRATKLNRRAMVGASAATLVGITACVGEAEQAEMTAVPATNTAPPRSTPTLETPATPATPPASIARESGTAATTVANGYTLVTSPRLPLFGIGADQLPPLMSGEILDWQTVGSAVSLPVEWIALAGGEKLQVEPIDSVQTYDELAAAMVDRPGGVAIVPLDQVDFRVNVLSIDGSDPLRDRESGPDGPINRIGVVGDIVPGRNVGIKMRTYGDYTYPFRDVAAELASYDLTIANLEGNLSQTIPPPEDPNTFDFVCDPAMIKGFELAGIDAVSLANNHTTWNESGWGVQALL